MSIGLVGRKRGMTRVFDDNGVSVPVTVIEVEPNRVVQKKDVDSDGYRALQVTVGTRRASRVTAASAGHYKKAGVAAGRGLWELRLADDEAWPTMAAPVGDEEGAEAEAAEVQVGDQLDVTRFEAGQVVDVVGRSIGKGFAGAIKRHN